MSQFEIIDGVETHDIRTPTSEKLSSGVSFHWWHKNKVPYHTHTFYEMMIIASGPVGHICNGVKYTMEKGDAFIVKPGDTHFFLSSSNTAHINLSATCEEFKKLCDTINPNLYDFLNLHAPKKIKLSKVELEYFLSLVNNVNLGTQDSDIVINTAAIKCAIINLLFIFNRILEIESAQSNTIPEWMVNFLNEINKPEVFNLPLDHLYKLAPYSQTMLNIHFKQYTGETLIHHIKKLKMDYAVQLLSYSNHNIAQIANELNYSSSHFIHEFKNNFGMSPAQYRNKLHKK